MRTCIACDIPKESTDFRLLTRSNSRLTYQTRSGICIACQKARALELKKIKENGLVNASKRKPSVSERVIERKKLAKFHKFTASMAW